MSEFGDADAGSVYYGFVAATERYGSRPFLRTPAVGASG